MKLQQRMYLGPSSSSIRDCRPSFLLFRSQARAMKQGSCHVHNWNYSDRDTNRSSAIRMDMHTYRSAGMQVCQHFSRHSVGKKTFRISLAEQDKEQTGIVPCSTEYIYKQFILDFAIGLPYSSLFYSFFLSYLPACHDQHICHLCPSGYLHHDIH